jgi:hypothetical protein
MPKITGPYWIYKRPKTKKFQITLYPASNLPPEVLQNWTRKGFSRFPLELAVYREPKTRAAAEVGAMALVEFLKNQLAPGNTSPLSAKETVGPTVGAWLKRLTSLEDNPHAARLMAEGVPYSPDTISLYQSNYERYLKNDPFMCLNMNEVRQAQALTLIARLGTRKTKDGRDLAGTRTFEIVIRFVRMAFKEYEEDHENWKNPFRANPLSI